MKAFENGWSPTGNTCEPLLPFFQERKVRPKKAEKYFVFLMGDTWGDFSLYYLFQPV